MMDNIHLKDNTHLKDYTHLKDNTRLEDSNRLWIKGSAGLSRLVRVYCSQNQ